MILRRLFRQIPQTVCIRAYGSIISSNGVSGDEALLRDWIRANGGYVHHDLMLSDRAQSGCRGIVARNTISDTYFKTHPLVTIPQDIWATVERAMSDLKDDYGVNMDSVIDLMGQDFGQQFVLSIWLSHQRMMGQDSPWYPYINILPQQPPCAWFMDDQQMDHLLQLYCPENEKVSWKEAVLDTKNALTKQSQVLQKWLKMKGIDGIRKEDIMWSLGHVMSRALVGLNAATSPGFFNLVMLPYIDLFNHEQGQGRPMGSYNIVVFARKELKPQTELCIEYLKPPSALQSFVKLGFVPREFL